MAVIAVLVAVAVPAFSGQLEKSRQSVDLSTLREAYATAKLALLNQDDSQSGHLYGADTTSLYDYKNGPAIADNTVFEYWYNVGTETLDATKPSDKSLGKATTSEVRADNSQLPEGVTYTASGALANTGGNDKDGTIAKAVLVKFVYTKDDGFTLSGITFAYSSSLLTVSTKRVVLTDATEELAANKTITLSDYVTIAGGNEDYVYDTTDYTVSATGGITNAGWSVEGGDDVATATLKHTEVLNPTSATAGTVKLKVKDTSEPALEREFGIVIYTGKQTAALAANVEDTTGHKKFVYDLSDAFQTTETPAKAIKMNTSTAEYTYTDPTTDTNTTVSVKVEDGIVTVEFSATQSSDVSFPITAVFQDKSGNWWKGTATLTLKHE